MFFCILFSNTIIDSFSFIRVNFTIGDDFVYLVLAFALPFADLERRGEIDILENAQYRRLTARLGQIRPIEIAVGRGGSGGLVIAAQLDLYLDLVASMTVASRTERGRMSAAVSARGSAAVHRQAPIDAGTLERVRVRRRQATIRARARVRTAVGGRRGTVFRYEMRYFVVDRVVLLLLLRLRLRLTVPLLLLLYVTINAVRRTCHDRKRLGQRGGLVDHARLRRQNEHGRGGQSATGGWGYGRGGRVRLLEVLHGLDVAVVALEATGIGCFVGVLRLCARRRAHLLLGGLLFLKNAR